jgi:hypothetical protein
MSARTSPLRIAMWSGPRNISTAMMRAFENRPDTAVVDEPFYAAYLAGTGLEHPMGAEVLAAQSQEWREVAASLVGEAPEGKAVFYQKHMTHHMLPGFDLDWTAACRNAFLIRRPDRVLASYVRKRGSASLEDIGVVRQGELYDRECQRLGAAAPVVDSDDVLADPRGVLGALCASLGLDFREEMLSWPAGRRPSDGVWAPVWYASVEASTGFGPAKDEQDAPALTDELRRVADAAQPYYETLAARRLRPQPLPA